MVVLGGTRMCARGGGRLEYFARVRRRGWQGRSAGKGGGDGGGRRRGLAVPGGGVWRGQGGGISGGLHASRDGREGGGGA